MDVISYENTADVAYDPHTSLYWDVRSMERELERTFEICHGCRMCFKFCPSFPSLFSAIDGGAGGDVRRLAPEDRKKVIGECYQCKLCYVKCPYTDRDHHKYNLNFPALMQRAVHIRAKEEGVDLRDSVLSNADLAGKMSTGLISGPVNRMMKMSVHRAVMQAVLGVHREKIMPEFHRTSFASWFGRFRKKSAVRQGPKVVLFSTCFVNYNNPELGRDALAVLEKNSCTVEHPRQNCCGMPGLNTGDLEWAVRKMQANVESLYPYARDGYKILAINPTCSLTMKKEYESFLDESWREKAQVVSGAVMDFNEFLFELKKQDLFNRDFKSTPKGISYHVPCHLRAQNIGYRSRDMMRLIPGADVQVIEECCGHNGTWAMKEEYFKLSLEAGKRAFDGIKEHPQNRPATDCPLAAIQIEQGAGVARPVHPLQILAKAYLTPEEGGWPDAVEADSRGGS